MHIYYEYIVSKIWKQPCISQSSPEKQPIGHIHTYIKKFISRNWIMQLWRLTCPKSVGQVSRLETQAGVNTAVFFFG